MLKVRYLNSFKKDLKLIQKRGIYNLEEFKVVVDMLQKQIPLPAKYKDHPLQGKEFKGCRDCHIRGDWVLIYRIVKQELILELMYTGTHSDLF